jgi:hypothetical protein
MFNIATNPSFTITASIRPYKDAIVDTASLIKGRAENVGLASLCGHP